MWLGDKPTRKVEKNTIYQGDNLPIMKELESGKIDMIYIDPPFCAQSVFKGKAFGNEDNAPEFNDEWGGGINSYIHWLKPRLRECHRLLSEKGCLFLHLDHKSVHYAKIELDKIFGSENFRNEIIWRRKIGSNTTGGHKSWPNNCDYILYYSKSLKHKFKPVYIDDSSELPDSIKKMYRYDDGDGLGYYRLGPMAAPSDSPTLKFIFKGIKPPSKGWRWTKQRMEKAFNDGLLKVNNEKGTITQKMYLKNRKGMLTESLWTDIRCLQGGSKEYIGYPTQKPLELLDRMIEATTNKGDVVADFFCGCGTTISSAQKMGRAWLGSDISKDAIKTIKRRMDRDHNLKIKVINTNQPSKAKIMEMDPFDFEHHVVSLIGIPNQKQRGDGGVDGHTYDHIPIQVKKSYKIGRRVIDEFYKHIQKRGAGIIIAHSFSKDLIEEKMKLENENGWVIDLIPTRDLLRDAA